MEQIAVVAIGNSESMQLLPVIEQQPLVPALLEFVPSAGSLRT